MRMPGIVRPPFLQPTGALAAALTTVSLEVLRLDCRYGGCVLYMPRVMSWLAR
jgi:hypothetical protein